MAFWWVNHKQTRDHEVRGGYLWSPMRNANGSYNQSYENMTLVRPGDIVFSYANGRIGAVGRVVERASASPKPSEFGSVGDYWANEGWLVGAYFTHAPKPLSPKTHIESIGPMLPSRYAPIRADGNGNQGCYLASISDALGHLLLALLDIEAVPDFTGTHYIHDGSEDSEVLEDIHLIEGNSGITETQRTQLTKARIGQGLFRKQVMLIDPRCRVTGVEEPRLLIASHIKPWRDSSNSERLNGLNGMMLSPHVDALFDKKFISFENDGQMLIHQSLPAGVLSRWAIKKDMKVAKFRPEQHDFLEHHRRSFAKNA